MTPEIVQVRVAGTDNFTYLVICPQSRKAIGIDPGMAPQSLLAAVAEHGVQLELLANTHGHRDHIAGNRELLAATGARLAAHPLDVPDAEIALGDGDRLQVGSLTVEVLHTPGHTPGSLSFQPPGAVITGDTLFVTRCGRADLPGSDPADLYRSLQRLAALPPATRVYPGHDYGPQPTSTIAFEREHNPYLQCPDLASFIRLRIG